MMANQNMILIKRLICVLIFSIFSIHSSYPQAVLGKLIGNNDKQVPAETVRSDAYGRTTPRGAIRGFFKSLAKEDYNRAAKYIDTRAFNSYNDSTAVANLIKDFENSLNKYGNILPLSVIDDTHNGYEDDGIELNLEKVGSSRVSGKYIPILLERVISLDNQKVWVFSKNTFTQLADLEVEYRNSIINNDYLPEALSKRWNGASIVEWLFMLLIAVGSYLISWLITILFNLIVSKLWRNYEKSRHGKVLRTLFVPLRLLLTVFLIVQVSRRVGMSIIVRQSFSVINMSILWLALFIFFWLLIDTLFHFGEQKLRDKNKTGSLSAILFFRTSVKFSLLVIAFIIILDTLGVDVTTGIAALGIGGIALALGAQKTVENLVGGISVIFDQPVNVGDFCKFGETIGTVEKIGIRSTRIRTLNRTIVTIPNADFSSRLIENYTSRDQFLFNTRIGLRYETTHDQMKFILKGLKQMLDKNEKVNPDPARVRFVDYGSDSLIVEMFAYIYAADWNEFLEIKEGLNLQMAKIIEDSGSGFAFPSQTVYLSKDSGILDTIRAKDESSK
jgi:MscS family membrane protein